MAKSSGPDSILAGGVFSKDLVSDFDHGTDDEDEDDDGSGNLSRGAPEEPTTHRRGRIDRFHVIIEFNESFQAGIGPARRAFFLQFPYINRDLLDRCYMEYGYLADTKYVQFTFETHPKDRLYIRNSLATKKYIFAILTRRTLDTIAKANAAYDARMREVTPTSLTGPSGPKNAPIYRIWKDHKVSRQVFQSSCTIKADAARLTFSTSGAGINWAVADSGIMGQHPHFLTHDTLILMGGIKHRDFTLPDEDDEASEQSALTDGYGHGTHIAGIIAGETVLQGNYSHAIASIRINSATMDQDAMKADANKAGGDGLIPTVDTETQRQDPVSGIAPKTKLLSLKVLDNRGVGRASYLISAIAYIRKLNMNSQENRIHGVNMSLGYIFDLDWYGAGQSPLCREVNSLVQAGVCVVAAAGNSGGATIAVNAKSSTVAYMCSIADPGNADKAITVGSTHREKPHQYGISYFSAKGPTLDGRMKPDLVAPGERIISCDAKRQASAQGAIAYFCEQSGTSQATAHVSGAAAALMSWRSEFRNNPDAVKDLLTETATDLKRLPAFQGSGMIDLMRAFLKV